MSVLMVDVGGSNLKVMIAPDGEIRKVPSGKKLTAKKMADEILSIAADWHYEKISIGYPGRTRDGRPAAEPDNLGGGWLDFDYSTALGKPVRFINDAAMQALGNYCEGRLLFIGFGTSIGTTIIVDDNIIPFEIGENVTNSAKFIKRVTKEALKRDGKKLWNKAVHNAVRFLQDLFFPDETILGGGNATLIKKLPSDCRCVDNQSAYLGALRLWEEADLFAAACATSWRISRK